MSPKVDPERDARIVDLYVNQEYNGQQIAALLEMPQATVYDALKRNGVPRRRPGGAHLSLPYSERVLFKRLYHDQGLSIREIAVKLELEESCVKSRMYRWGIPLRSRSEAVKIARSRQTRKQRSEQSRRGMNARDRESILASARAGGLTKQANRTARKAA